MKNFLDTEKLINSAEALYKKDKNSTLWDLMVRAIAESANIRPYIIWILSDFSIVDAVARGYGLDYIRNSLEVKRQDIVATCRIWGMFYWTETLDFDPVLTYIRGMTVQEYKERLSTILSQLPDDMVIKNAINNVEKYFNIKDLLDDWENNNDKE